jgi:hypothetical protein
MNVGKNPGHIVKNECGAYSGKSPLEIVEGMFKNPTWDIPTKGETDTRPFTFHRNLIRYIHCFLDFKEGDADDEVFKSREMFYNREN